MGKFVQELNLDCNFSFKVSAKDLRKLLNNVANLKNFLISSGVDAEEASKALGC